MNRVYESVVFLQGDDYVEFEATLYPQSTDDDLHRGWLTGSPDLDAALNYLLQWDCGDGGDGHDSPSAGSCDRAYERDGYVMTWNTGFSYAGLDRVRLVTG